MNDIEENKSIKFDVYNEQYKNLREAEILSNIEDEEYNKNIEWKEYHENIFIDWADKALCYRWLHSKSCLKYVKLRNLYTIPVIILSTLTGTANFALERIPKQYHGYCQIIIGSFNILAGIITTISQFLKINELSEAHKVSYISWDKFYRNIRVELVKSPSDRTNVICLMRVCKDEYDRLIEISPIIDKNIIKKFNNTFKCKNKLIDEKKKEILKTLHQPEILDFLESTKNIVYKVNKKTNNEIIDIINKKDKLNKEYIIENFIKTFEKEFSRKPSIIEIYNNLEDKLSHETINNYINLNKL